MMIRINVLILASLDPNYKEKLVQNATNNYLEKKRYLTKPKSVQKTVLKECACYRRFIFTEKEI